MAKKEPQGDEIKRHDSRLGRFYPIEIDGVEYLWPSITTIEQAIAKPALVNWAANTERELVIEAATQLYLDVVGTPPMKDLAFRASLAARLGKVKAWKRELEKAADIGTQAHKKIEWMLRKQLGQMVGPEPKTSEKAAWAVMAFEDWARSVDLKVLLIEQRVYSVTNETAGTLDLYALVNGVPTVADWKTSKAIYKEALIQNAFYRKALLEMGHGDPQAGLVLRLPKVDTDPQFEAIDVDQRAHEMYDIPKEQAEDYLYGLYLAAKTLWWAQYREEMKYQAKVKAAREAKKEAANIEG
jgi:hypothetical protein